MSETVESVGLEIDVALTPDQARAWQGTVCVVIDVLRASSAIVTLFEQGIARLYPEPDAERAEAAARARGCLLGGEGSQATPFDFGNQPSQIALRQFAGQEAVFCTVNGTKVLLGVAETGPVLVGCFLNASACCRQAIELALAKGMRLGFVCAGNRGVFALDDAVCAGHLVETTLKSLKERQIAPRLSEAAHAALLLNRSFGDAMTAFQQTFSAAFLVRIGQEADLPFCAQIDTSQVVPLLHNNETLELVRADDFFRQGGG